MNYTVTVAGNLDGTANNLVTWINGQATYEAAYNTTTKILTIVRNDNTPFTPILHQASARYRREK